MKVAARWMPAWVVGAAFAMFVVMPREAADVGVLVVLIVAPLLIASVRLRGSRVPRELRLQIGLMALVPLALLVSALASTNRYVGLIGRVQQHNGALLWLGCFGVMAVMAVRPRSGDIERLVKTISAAVAMLSIAVLVDAAGVDFGSQYSPEPSGLMTSSQTLGHALVIGVGTTLAWRLLPRRKPVERACANSIVLLCVAALLVADARAAVAALVLSAGGLALVGWRARTSPIAPASFAGVAGFVVAGAGALGSVVAATQSHQPWWDSLNSTLSDRLVLWRAAVVSVSARPWLGVGPDQFDGVLSWDGPGGALPQMTVSHDAHNLLLTMAATGGLIAAVAFLVALVAGAFALAQALLRAHYSPAALALACGLIAWFISTQLAWVNLFGGLIASLLYGSLLGAGRPQADDGGAPARLAIASGTWLVVVIALLVFAGKGLVSEVRWALPSSPQDLYTTALIALDNPDPTLAEGFLQKVAVSATKTRDPRGPGALALVALKVEPDSQWSAMAARALVDYEMLKATVDGEPAQGVSAAVQRARVTDSTTGVWDYLGAVYATQLGDDAMAKRHARAALKHRVGRLARPWLESVAGP